MDKCTIEKNCQQLMEYLRSTLYDKTPEKVQIEKLDEEFQVLGQGIAYTQHLIKELLQYSEDISLGNLNPEQPSRDNFLCANLKNLHSNLKHLTWQAEQVAKGDYSQHVSYLGEFSESFNEMIRQLKEREEAIRARTAMMEEYNRFFLEISSKREEWIIIASKESRELLYCNRKGEPDSPEGFDGAFCANCPYHLDFLTDVIQEKESANYRQKEIMDDHGGYYEISAFHMEWDGQDAVAYVTRNITKEKEYSNKMASIAYNDALTGIKNRRFFDEFIASEDLEDKWDIFCYMDLDGLKFVNDYYGHEEGDDYITSFVSLIKNSFRASDTMIRIGGDEFCMFYNQISEKTLVDSLERIREQFIAENEKPYPVSFSYGIIVNKKDHRCFADVMKLADDRMYEYKKLHKKERRV